MNMTRVIFYEFQKFIDNPFSNFLNKARGHI